MALRQPFTGSNSSTVKSHNMRAILLALLKHDYLSRVHLAKLTGLSTTTITNLITELLALGIVLEEGTDILERRPGAGRPRKALRLVPEARYAIGVHIGVGKVRVAVTNLRAQIVGYDTFSHPLDKPAEIVLNDIAETIRQVVEQSNINMKDIIGIGIGASGLVDPTRGVNVLAPNLKWQDVPIQAWLSRHLGQQVTVENNIRAMALGEALFGAARDVRVSAFVSARVGVGAGFVVDGQLYRGSGAGAGEIGHATIIPDGGEVCRCGNRGCLETLVSEPVILKLAQRLCRQPSNANSAQLGLSKADLTIEDIFAAARAGDEATLNMLQERARYMGIALANLVNTLNPELILLGGVFAQGHDLLLPMVEATIRERAFANLGEPVCIKPTSFGKNAGVIGGAALALTSFFYQNNGVYPPQTQHSGVII